MEGHPGGLTAPPETMMAGKQQGTTASFGEEEPGGSGAGDWRWEGGPMCGLPSLYGRPLWAPLCSSTPPLEPSAPSKLNSLLLYPYGTSAWIYWSNSIPRST